MNGLKSQNQVLMYGLIIIVLILLYRNSTKKQEGFEIGEPRYGLRGDLLKTSDIKHKFIYPTSHYRIDNSPGPMYEGRHEPMENKCDIVDCPEYYDNPDKVCYSCSGNNYQNPKQPKLCGTDLIYEQIYDQNKTTPNMSYDLIME
tara:strand:+ start:1507 stop:1941 length:435 start_codon:yes stop_codon:yes gene_type:complete